MSYKILIVDDEANIRNSLSAMLADENFECFTAGDGEEALQLVHDEYIHLIITDLVMPKMDGIELLAAVRKDYKDTRVILLTAYGTVESAVTAMKYGAVDFLLKPIDFDMLSLKVKESLKDLEIRRELQWFKDHCNQTDCGSCLKIVGESPGLTRVLRQAEKLAKSDLTALITGESGVGKEVLARMIHSYSDRTKEPFVPVNCGGLPETLLESELFGVVKGAFSGADRNRDGLIRTAGKGTLFLDEISELTLSAQTKLLRVLQDGEIRPLGSDKSSTAACRFLAASNKNLKEEVEKGRFREDLYYRVSTIVIEVPPLRERWEDIPLLVQHFIYCQSARNGIRVPIVTSDAISVLQSYNWPGNVRQLYNVVKRALIMNEGDTLTAGDFPTETFEVSQSTIPQSLKAVVNRFEKSYIISVIQECNFDKKAAAQKLNISLTTLYQKIKDLGISASLISEKPE